jgi:Cu/Ag efflux protein CusF
MHVASAKRTTSLVFAIVAILSVALTSACSKKQDEPNGTQPAANSAPHKSYSARGKIRSFGVSKDNVTIAHQDIPGYMKAMTMMFEVDKPEILKDLKVDDDVTFTFGPDNEGRLHIESISKAN